MSQKYKGERLRKLKDSIGKTVADVAGEEGDDFYFVRFQDGSFVYGETSVSGYGDDPTIEYDWHIDDWHQERLGILREDHDDIERLQQERRAAEATVARRKMYEELRQEFEGQP